MESSLHFVLNESEEANKRELDNGELGVERMLYYRELIARFGHHLSLQWNLCEEYNLGLDLGPDRMRIRPLCPRGRSLRPPHHGSPGRTIPWRRWRSHSGTRALTLPLSSSISAGSTSSPRPCGRQRPKRAGPCRPDGRIHIDKGTNKSYIPVDDPELYRKQKLWPTYLSREVRRPKLLLTVEHRIVDRYVRLVRSLIDGELVHRGRQRPARLGRCLAHGFGNEVDPALIELDRGKVKARIAECERQRLQGVAGRMNRDGVVVRIDRADVAGEFAHPLGPQVQPDVVFFAEVPLQGRVVGEPRDQLAVIELPLDAKFAVVEFALVGLFALVEDEVQDDPLPLGVCKNLLPLAELADVVVQVVVGGGAITIGRAGPGQTSLPSPPIFIVRK